MAHTHPDLTGRTARCVYCGSTRPSSDLPPFFEYRGPGSDRAEHTCGTCGFYDVAHSSAFEINPATGRPNNPRNEGKSGHPCRSFTPVGPDEHDRFYCGCRGWD